MQNYELIKKISAQQGEENTALWGIGEQLKEICKRYPGAAELVLQDLDNEEMSLKKCAEKIKEYADKLHKETKKNNICVTPQKAEEIICKFYGIDRGGAAEAVPGVVSLADLM